MAGVSWMVAYFVVDVIAVTLVLAVLWVRAARTRRDVCELITIVSWHEHALRARQPRGGKHAAPEPAPAQPAAP